MNWTFHPKNKELTTSLPLSVEINNWQGTPRVILEGVGDLELKPISNGVLKTDFYLTLPGTYRLQLLDANSSYAYEFSIKQHTYLDFTNEFGFFLALFIVAMGGIVLWVKKIMKKKMPLT